MRAIVRHCVLSIVCIAWLSACNAVRSPINNTQVAARTSIIPFDGYADTSGQQLYLQVATVQSPSAGNPAHWTWISPAGVESATPVVFTTASVTATHLFAGTNYYSWSQNLNGIPNGRWFAVGGGVSQAKVILRTADWFNSTNINASAILSSTAAASVSGSNPQVVASVSCGNNPSSFNNVVNAATNLGDLAPCQASASPILTLRVNTTQQCNAACSVSGKAGACAAGVWSCPPNGTPFCSQVVFPVAESCANAGVDNNCDGVVDNVPGLGAACTSAPPAGAGCQTGFVAPGTQQCVGSGSSATLSCVVTAIGPAGTNGGFCTVSSNPSVCGSTFNENCDSGSGGNPCAPGLGCMPACDGNPTTFVCKERFEPYCQPTGNAPYSFCDEYQTAFLQRTDVPSPQDESDTFNPCWRVPGSVSNSNLNINVQTCCSDQGSVCSQYEIIRD